MLYYSILFTRVKCFENDEENSNFLMMRIILPTCELKRPVKDAILNIEEQVQNFTKLVEIRKLRSRQYLKDEMRNLLDEVTKVQLNTLENIYILLNKTRKGIDIV